MAIDDASLARIDRWPWDRERLAALADELFERQRAAVVAFDIFFAEPQGDGSADRCFAAALAGRRAPGGARPLARGRTASARGSLPPPVGAAGPAGLEPYRFASFTVNIEPLAGAAAGTGFVNFVPDADGLVRRLPLLAAVDGHGLQEPLALATLSACTGALAVGVDAWRPPGRGAVARGRAQPPARSTSAPRRSRALCRGSRSTPACFPACSTATPKRHRTGRAVSTSCNCSRSTCC